MWVTLDRQTSPEPRRLQPDGRASPIVALQPVIQRVGLMALARAAGHDPPFAVLMGSEPAERRYGCVVVHVPSLSDLGPPVVVPMH